jgi:hypothetical protein
MPALSRRDVLTAIAGAAVVGPAQAIPSTSQPDPFAVALAAYREAERAYCDACTMPGGGASRDAIEAAEAEVSRTCEAMSARMLDLLRTPATTPAHALALLAIGHQGAYRSGMLDEVLPVPHLPLDDELLSNSDEMDRAFIEAGMRTVGRLAGQPS